MHHEVLSCECSEYDEREHDCGFYKFEKATKNDLIICRSFFVWNDSTVYYFCCVHYWSHLRNWQSACSCGQLSASTMEVTCQLLGNRPTLDIPVRTQFVATSGGHNHSRAHSRNFFRKKISRERTEKIGLREAKDSNKLIGE